MHPLFIERELSTQMFGIFLPPVKFPFMLRTVRTSYNKFGRLPMLPRLTIGWTSVGVSGDTNSIGSKLNSFPRPIYHLSLQRTAMFLPQPQLACKKKALHIECLTRAVIQPCNSWQDGWEAIKGHPLGELIGLASFIKMNDLERIAGDIPILIPIKGVDVNLVPFFTLSLWMLSFTLQTLLHEIQMGFIEGGSWMEFSYIKALIAI